RGSVDTPDDPLLGPFDQKRLLGVRDATDDSKLCGAPLGPEILGVQFSSKLLRKLDLAQGLSAGVDPAAVEEGEEAVPLGPHEVALSRQVVHGGAAVDAVADSGLRRDALFFQPPGVLIDEEYIVPVVRHRSPSSRTHASIAPTGL